MNIETAPLPPDAGNRGRPRKYDWPKLFDGQPHLVPEVDVPSTGRNFARLVRRAAVRDGVLVRIAVRAGKGVYVQRVPS